MVDVSQRGNGNGNCRPSWFGSSPKLRWTDRADCGMGFRLWCAGGRAIAGFGTGANFETAAVDQGVTVPPLLGSSKQRGACLCLSNQARSPAVRCAGLVNRWNPASLLCLKQMHCRFWIFPAAKFSRGCVSSWDWHTRLKPFSYYLHLFQRARQEMRSTAQQHRG